jgi:hypothetical protein
MATTMLGVWMALGLVVLLVYSALPGASNNPRVFIPALPALCILTAAGVMQLGRRVRLIMLTVIFTVFVIVNGIGVVYQVLQARVTSAAMPVWSALRDAPPGVILTDQYWQAALYTHQPVTWFEHDPVFQRNIMHHATNFRRYLAGAPIRYRCAATRSGCRGEAPGVAGSAMVRCIAHWTGSWLECRAAGIR